MSDETRNSVVRLNQHFLRDSSALEQIVSLSEIEPQETVLEIGPGQGSLTGRIAERAKKVVAIEADARLKADLDALQAQYPNVSVVYGDAIEMRFPKFDRMVANIPFNITEPLITKLMGEKFVGAYLLVGESFADNCTTMGGYTTRLGLLTRAYFKTEQLLQVPKESFDPIPSTDGVLISLSPVKKSDLREDFPLYMLHCMWDQRTKPLKDALSSALYQYASGKITGEIDVSRVIRDFERDHSGIINRRVDAIGNTEFLDLYHGLSGMKLNKLFGRHKPRGGAQNWRKTYAEHLR
ncbi:MAG TPA: rRNA adenine dimethyltransferase family protein [Candidatus Nanoarchaeia archaeon]|nr:rRNA adenine dimethyltransferase family protein [Candidatus Nanoarchaeia archaeon]